MSGNIEEVGARLVVKQRAAFRAAMRESSRDTQAYAKTTVAANKDIAAATKLAANAQADYAAKSQLAADATAKAMEAKTAAVRAAAAGDREATVAAKSYSDAMTAEMVAANNAKRAASAQSVAASAQVSALRKASVAHDVHARSVTASSAAINGLAKVGKVAVLGGITAATVAAYEGAKAFATYQQALEAVHTQAGLAQPRVDRLGRSLLAMTGSGQFTLGPTDMANILYRIVSSTGKTKPSDRQIMAMVKAAAQLTAIGGPGTDPEQTARIIGGIRATGIKGAGNPQNIVALANATVGTGDIRMSDFVDFVGTGVLSSARLAGIKLPEIASLLSLLGDNLQAGNVSGHSIAHALQLLAAPNHIALQAFHAIGLPGTDMGNLMRTKGLTAALDVFMRHLQAPLAGGSATGDYLSKYLGLTKPQIKQAQTVGFGKMGTTGQTAIDMILARMFGGAKQAIPIMTVLTEVGRYKEGQKQATAQLANFGDTWKKTMAEPANQMKAFNAQWQTFEVQIGGKVLPEVISLAHWLEVHSRLVKDIATGIGVLLIPATALWLGKLATDGTSKLGGFFGLMRNTNGEISKTGGLAGAQSGGLNTFGKAITGVTTAIGIYELGAATAGHGAAGLATAGLGGALAGMAAGLAIGGPWGAAIGGAIGLVGGLASNLWNSSRAAAAANKAMQTWMTQTYQADKFMVGHQFQQGILSYLQSNGAGANALATAGVKLPAIGDAIRSGNAIGSPAGLQLQAALRAGKISQQQFKDGLAALNALVTNFSSIVNNLDSIATISGQVSQHVADITANAQSLTGLIFAQPGGKPGRGAKAGTKYTPPTLGQLLTPPGRNAPHRALGGSVTAGRLYQVNEHGVEMFMPHVDGQVLPHASLSMMSAPATTGTPAGHNACVVVVEKGAVVVHESGDPQRTYAATRQGLADALARA